MAIMKMFWFIRSGLLLALLVIGCTKSQPSSQMDSGESEPELHPPSSIDVVSCASVTSNSAGAVDACNNCCNERGFSASNFDTRGQCTCGQLVPADTITCAEKTADAGDCSACCAAANFADALLQTLGTPSCTCSGKVDMTSCARLVYPTATLDDCSICCLNGGYLRGAFMNQLECRCATP